MVWAPVEFAVKLDVTKRVGLATEPVKLGLFLDANRSVSGEPFWRMAGASKTQPVLSESCQLDVNFKSRPPPVTRLQTRVRS